MRRLAILAVLAISVLAVWASDWDTADRPIHITGSHGHRGLAVDDSVLVNSGIRATGAIIADSLYGELFGLRSALSDTARIAAGDSVAQVRASFSDSIDGTARTIDSLWTFDGLRLSRGGVSDAVAAQEGIEAYAQRGMHRDLLAAVGDSITWTDLGKQGSETHIYSLAYLGNGIVLAGTEPSGKIFRSTDYGATWTDLGQQGAETHIWCLAYLGNGIVLAGTDPNGKIFRSTMYGYPESYNLGRSDGAGIRRAGKDTVAIFTNAANRVTIDPLGHVRPGADKTQNLGAAAASWDTTYSKVFTATADIPHLSNRDVLREVRNIKGSGQYDEHGMEIVDDWSLPRSMMLRHTSVGTDTVVTNIVTETVRDTTEFEHYDEDTGETRTMLQIDDREVVVSADTLIYDHGPDSLWLDPDGVPKFIVNNAIGVLLRSVAQLGDDAEAVESLLLAALDADAIDGRQALDIQRSHAERLAALEAEVETDSDLPLGYVVLGLLAAVAALEAQVLSLKSRVSKLEGGEEERVG